MDSMRRKTALPVLLLLFAVGCSSFVRNTNRSLLAFEAAYTIEEPVRATFCKGKVPQPPPCVKAQAAAKAGYVAYQHGSELLAQYIETKGTDVRTQIILLLPEVISATVDLTAAISELK
jgi:hypothetical protein